MDDSAHDPATASTVGTQVDVRAGESYLEAGSMVGEYQVTGAIGRGGMGVVYAGVHPVIGKEVAIKVLRAGVLHGPGVAERFVQEARAVNQIRHPNIIDVFAYGTLAERPYIVMERLHGRTLAARIARGPLTLDEIAAVIVPVTRALEAAHDVGIIHRDLKPDNVFLVDDGPTPVVKLLDFGIAKVMPSGPATAVVTDTGMMLGTPRYMAPEQARGQPLDPGVDVYALGVMLYEMLVGEDPFKADNAADAIAMHLCEVPPRVAQRRPLPARLDQLVADMLAKEPAQRPALATVRAVCEAVADHDRAPVRRAPRRGAVVGAVLVAGAGGALGWWLLRGDARPAPPPAVVTAPAPAPTAVTPEGPVAELPTTAPRPPVDALVPVELTVTPPVATVKVGTQTMRLVDGHASLAPPGRDPPGGDQRRRPSLHHRRPGGRPRAAGPGGHAAAGAGHTAAASQASARGAARAPAQGRAHPRPLRCRHPGATMIRRLPAAAIVCVTLLASRGSARAEDASATFERGLKAYAEGQYADAAEAFERAYAARPAAGVLFNLAQARRKAGQCAAAVEAYRRFLRAPTADAKATAEANLIESEACAASVEAGRTEPVSVEAGRTEPASVEAGRTEPDRAAPGGATPLGPPPGGAAPGSTAPVDAAPVDPRPAAPAATVPDQRSRRIRTLGLVTGAVGVAAMAAGGIIYGRSAVVCYAKCDEPGEERTRRNNATLSGGLLIGGGVAVATGVGLYVWGYLSDTPSKVIVTPTTGGAVAAASWAF
ncbi:MAG: protein kinase [Kofleriaceae bacterium]